MLDGNAVRSVDRAASLLIALGETSGDNEQTASSVMFPVGQVKDGIDAFLLCFLYERAGMNQGGVAVRKVR